MVDRRPGILVLCTGNSCRSQIAQAYLEKFARGRFQVYSAGTRPTREIHPMTIEVMADDGIDLSGRTPSDYRELFGKVSVDYLILVCDGAARACPSSWPGVVERLLWPFEDPAAFVGGDEETRARFLVVRDAIRARVEEWLA